MKRFPIAATIPLDLTIESAGAGVTGQSPVAIVQRLSDAYYYNDSLASGSRFASDFASNAMTEVDDTNLPGLYRYLFDHSEDDSGSELFFVRLINEAGTLILLDQVIAFGPFASASAPDLCSLFGTVLDMAGNPAVNEMVRVSIVPNTVLGTGGKPGISVNKIDTYTSETGAFAIDIIRGLTIRLQIPKMGYDKKIVIPNASSVNFADL